MKSAGEKYNWHSESVSLAVPINEARLLPGFGSFKQQAHISSFHDKFGDFRVWVTQIGTIERASHMLISQTCKMREKSIRPKTLVVPHHSTVRFGGRTFVFKSHTACYWLYGVEQQQQESVKSSQVIWLTEVLLLNCMCTPTLLTYIHIDACKSLLCGET